MSTQTWGKLSLNEWNEMAHEKERRWVKRLERRGWNNWGEKSSTTMALSET